MINKVNFIWSIIWILTVVEQTNCQVETCGSNPCQNGGICLEIINGFTCNCLQGYTGLQCETNIDECQSRPCQNGGNCRDGINSYTCNCLSGYTGSQCETNINECDSSPCQNGGTCLDRINSFICVCQPGYTGSQCEGNINECSSLPCVHGGCQDLLNAYTCQCIEGYTGHQCATEINHCASEPCQNGGSCYDIELFFVCVCSENFHGGHCELEILEEKERIKVIILSAFFSLLCLGLVGTIAYIGYLRGWHNWLRARTSSSLKPLPSTGDGNLYQNTAFHGGKGTDDSVYENTHFQGTSQHKVEPESNAIYEDLGKTVESSMKRDSNTYAALKLEKPASEKVSVSSLIGRFDQGKKGNPGNKL